MTGCWVSTRQQPGLGSRQSGPLLSSSTWLWLIPGNSTRATANYCPFHERKFTGSWTWSFPSLTLLSSHKGDTHEDNNDDGQPQTKPDKAATALPPLAARTSGARHMPELVDQKSTPRCWNPGCSQCTKFTCTECNLFLCITATRNCYWMYHSSKELAKMLHIETKCAIYCTPFYSQTNKHRTLEFFYYLIHEGSYILQVKQVKIIATLLSGLRRILQSKFWL